MILGSRHWAGSPSGSYRNSVSARSSAMSTNASGLTASAATSRACGPDPVRSLDDLRRPAVHAQERPARPLPVRAVRRAARGGRTHPRLLGHDGQADGRRVHARRRRTLRRGLRALPRAGRRRARDDAAQRQRLRALHRRPRLPLRRRAPRHDGRAGLGWHDGAPAAADQDFRPDVSLYAELRAHARPGASRIAVPRPDDDQPPLRASLGAEPWTEAMRAEIDGGLGVRACNIYGLSEVIGPGVACECAEERAGSHVKEDHFLPEVVDPESGAPLPEGEVGVLVFTALTKQALPLLRYWTGDLASLSSEPCSCGRTLVRMSADPGPDRRHAGHPRRERVPHPGRGGHRPVLRAVSPLPAGRQPRPARWTRSTCAAELTQDIFRSVGIERLDGARSRRTTPLRDLAGALPG